LPEQGGLTVDEFPDGVVAIVGDNKEIMIARLIPAHETHAILIGSGQLQHICFDAHVAVILLWRGPEVETRSLHQNAIGTFEIIHDTTVVGKTVPAGGVGLELILKEDGAGGWWRSDRRGCGGAGDEKKEERHLHQTHTCPGRKCDLPSKSGVLVGKEE
jgi:hypothetical protein